MRKITLFLLSLVFTMTAFAQVDNDLKGKKISAIGEPATAVVEGQWYILNNVGRKNCVSEEGTFMKMRATDDVKPGDIASTKAGYLFKFTKAADGAHWNIASGNCKYFALGWNSSAISDVPVNFLVGHQDEKNAPSVFYLYDDDNKYAADGQGVGENFVGWSNTIPTGTNGNDAYRLLPISFENGRRMRSAWPLNCLILLMVFCAFSLQSWYTDSLYLETQILIPISQP